MYNELQGNNLTLQNATMGRIWLEQMSEAAARNSVGIQYCMTFPRMLMTSVLLDAVSQWRASDDYGPGQTDGCRFPYCVYYIGTTSLLSWAIGLAPAKDNFWSTEWQPGSHYSNTTREPYSEMQVAIASYSTGPVTPSDGVGFTNVSLVKMSCTQNGTLLQPTRPMSAIDACYGGDAFGYADSQPQPAKDHVYPITSSHTAIPTVDTSLSTKWTNVLAVGLANKYSLSVADIPLDVDGTATHLLTWTGYSAELHSKNVTVEAVVDIRSTDTATLLAFTPCNYTDFQLWHAAPVLGNSGTVFLGEPVRYKISWKIPQRLTTGPSCFLFFVFSYFF